MKKTLKIHVALEWYQLVDIYTTPNSGMAVQRRSNEIPGCKGLCGV